MYKVEIANQFKIISDVANRFVIATSVNDTEIEALLKDCYDADGNNFSWGNIGDHKSLAYVDVMLHSHVMFVDGVVVKDRYDVATYIFGHGLFDTLMMAPFNGQ